MKMTWITQAGFCLQWGSFTVMLDPYLSDTCGELNPASHRRQPVDPAYLAMKPDVIVTTHDHLDHFDEPTLTQLLPETGFVTFLGSAACWAKAKDLYKGRCNPVFFRPHNQWTENGITFEAVKAEHSEQTAIGVIVRDGSHVLYFSGDTLYNTDVLADLPGDIDIAVLPVNGKGNNMNAADAARFADAVGAKKTIPVHIGLFDDLTPQIFRHPSAWYLTPYETVEI